MLKSKHKIYIDNNEESFQFINANEIKILENIKMIKEGEYVEQYNSQRENSGN